VHLSRISILRITSYLGDGSVELSKEKPFYLTLPSNRTGGPPSASKKEEEEKRQRHHARLDPLAEMNQLLGKYVHHF
jgi:hypothetical protein